MAKNQGVNVTARRRHDDEAIPQEFRRLLRYTFSQSRFRITETNLSPYFKLKAGNFRTRDEAVQYQKMLAPFFPKGVFIMNDSIEVTPEKE